MSFFVVLIFYYIVDKANGKLPCDGVRVGMKGQIMSIPLDTCTISQSEDGFEAYSYHCDQNKQFFWNVWTTEDCTGNKKSIPIDVLIQEMNGTLIESKCDNIPCKTKIIQNLYEINKCGEAIDENTKYSQSAMMNNQCIVGPRYSVKHKCFKGNSKKVKSVYYSDNKCKKKIKEYVSHCDINREMYNKDSCTESGADDQLGVISDNCCIHLNI